jgi:hypothetical protein
MSIGVDHDKRDTKSIKYSIDGGPMTKYSSPCKLDISERDTVTESKAHEFEVVPENLLINTRPKGHMFIVKN